MSPYLKSCLKRDRISTVPGMPPGETLPVGEVTMKRTCDVALGCLLLLAMASPSRAQLISENFDSVTVPALPAGWTVENVNGDAYEWQSYGSYSCSAPNDANMRWNSAAAMDDWLFTPGVALSTGHTYTLTFNYRVAGATFPEMLTVYIGTSASAAAMTTVLVDLGTISNTTCIGATVADFTVPAVGTYYIGFWGHSAADMFRLTVDDVVLTETSTPVEMSAFSIE
jgi:hypothetical protein